MTPKRGNILPVIYPMITTYPAYSAVLAILGTHKESYDWIYSHFLQIFAIDKINRGDFSLSLSRAPYKSVFFGDVDNRLLVHSSSEYMFFSKDRCQYLDIFEVPTDLFASYNESVVSLIKRSIDLNMYLYVYADQSKIRAFNRSTEGPHPLFIFGYDDNMVNVADFVNGKFTFFECAYDEIENAFHSAIKIPYNIMNLSKDSEAIALVRYNNYAPFIFDYSYIQDTIREYLYPNKSKVESYDNYIMSRFSFSDEKLKTYMGIDVYQYLADLFELQYNAGIDIIDVRMYHAMYDHKEMMVKRIEYFLGKGYLSSEKSVYLEEYKAVRDRTLSIRNAILKHNITKDRKILAKTVLKLAETKELEIPLLKRIFDID